MVCDAVQAAGSLGLNMRELGVSAMALSAHKFYGPKGIGILYLRKGARLQPELQGGGQEYGVRSGTENVAYAVGASVALERAQARRQEYNAHLLQMRDALFAGLLAELPGTRVNGDLERRLPGNVHVSFRGIEAQAVLMGLDMQGICASSGSACISASLEPSHVLSAIGVPPEYIYGGLRLTLGAQNTPTEVQRVLNCLTPLVRRLQALSPVASAG